MVGHPTPPKIRTRVRRSEAKRPMTDVEAMDAPTRINKLPDTTRSQSEEPAAFKEQRISQVELLMLKGFTTPFAIGSMLSDLSTTQIEKYIDLVLARWEITGGNRNFEVKRGQQINRVEQLMQESWVLYQNFDAKTGKDVAVKNGILRSLGTMNKQLSELHGITAKSVTRHMTSSGDRSDHIKRMEKQKKLVEIANTMVKLLEGVKTPGDDAKIIDAEAN